MDTFQALVARQDGDRITASVETLKAADLPPGDVTIRVLYSSVNFKDALALTPGGGVVRNYPVVPGIDLTGEVVESQSPDFQVGDPVLAHGYQIGTGHHGGYAEYARLPADQVVALGSLSPRDGAAIGTAGFTAAMSVQALIDWGITPGRRSRRRHRRHRRRRLGQRRPAGGRRLPGGRIEWQGPRRPTDSKALALLRLSAGCPPIPTPSHGHWPRRAGRQEWTASAAPRWPTCSAPSTTAARSPPAASPAAPALHTTVMPFILRGVALLGMDSVQMPIGPRRELWARLGDSLRPRHLDSITSDVDVKDVVGVIDQVRAGKFSGRAVVRVAGGF